MCNRKEFVISKPSPDVSVSASSGEPELVFENTGWRPEDVSGFLTMTVNSADGVPAQLKKVFLVSFNALFLQMSIFRDGVETLEVSGDTCDVAY